MPFTCEFCGRSHFPDLIPAVGQVLRCPYSSGERPFVRVPLLIVTGTAGVGKSTLCACLAGSIPGVLFLDADIHATDLASVIPPSHDYPGFWRSMMRLAHELAQNDVVVVYFSVTLPDQVLTNVDLLGYFDAVHFLCLTCSPSILRERITRRDGRAVADARTEIWLDFDRSLLEAAARTPKATVFDAGGLPSDIEAGARRWVQEHLPR